MTEEELKECKEFLTYFGVDYTKDILVLTSGGNSVIMNEKTQWKKFLGVSINQITEAVAKKMNKKTKWI